ncbi:MAG: hypothetical protein ACD_76C00092G0001 [uncultured bacterium]|nr:MAG: hypothetical protein ACD_76C00092G0001 [uncultured bacterium]
MVLDKLLRDLKPAYAALAWDRAEPTVRKEMYTLYKATREKQAQELYDQFPIAEEIANAYGIPSYSFPKYEADDVIGTISHGLSTKNNDIETYIVTGDMDALQLVDDNTKVLFLQKGVSETKLYDENAVREKFGFGPEALCDYKALRGDPSDNIPGVRGIGEKTAKILIQKYGTLKNISKQAKAGRLEQVSDRITNLLRDQKEQAELSLKLATIVRDLDLKWSAKEAELGEPDTEKLRELYKNLQFVNLLKRMQPSVKPQFIAAHEGATSSIATCRSENEIKSIADELVKQNEIAVFGIEKQQNLFSGKNIAMFFAYNDKLIIMPELDKKTLTLLASVFESETPKKIGHDLKALSKLLRSFDLELRGATFDLMIGSYLIASHSRAHDFASIALNILKAKVPELPKTITDESELEKIAKSVRMFAPCAQEIEHRLKEINSWKLFCEIEMPLVPILRQMENNGAMIDSAFLAKLSKEFEIELSKLEKQIHKLADSDFNIASPLQLAEILFEKLQIPTKGLKKTKTGVSTAAPELEKIRNEHKIVPFIFEHRELSKLKSTYVDALPALADSSGRVHTTYNQTITATGRLSSSDPNLQNIPIRTELGREIRKAFIAPKGKTLLALDYSQIELRLAAVISRDQGMLNAFHKGADIHTATAASIWETDPDKVTREQRRSAKAINFGILYGMGPRALAQSAGVSMEEARDFIEKYFEAHPGIRAYIDSTKKQAHSDGFVQTLFGRRRYFPEINSGLQQLIASAERMAINMPVQGSAADIMKMAMIAVDHLLQDQNLGEIKMIMQVHDELVFEADEKIAAKAADEIKRIMESVAKFEIPFIVDVSIGKNWGEMEKI